MDTWLFLLRRRPQKVFMDKSNGTKPLSPPQAISVPVISFHEGEKMSSSNKIKRVGRNLFFSLRAIFGSQISVWSLRPSFPSTFSSVWFCQTEEENGVMEEGNEPRVVSLVVCEVPRERRRQSMNPPRLPRENEGDKLNGNMYIWSKGKILFLRISKYFECYIHW